MVEILDVEIVQVVELIIDEIDEMLWRIFIDWLWMFVVHVELVALELAVEVEGTVEELQQIINVEHDEMVETVLIDDKLFMHICIEHQKQFV